MQELTSQHYTMVKKLASHLGYGRSGLIYDQEDMCQDGMIGLLEAAKKYDDSMKVPFPAYANYIVRYRMIDGVRKADYLRQVTGRSGPSIDAIEGADQLLDFSYSGDYVYKGVLSKERLEFVKSCAEKCLNKRQHYVFSLYYYRGLEMPQIAKVVGTTEGAVSMLIKESLRLVRGYVKRKLTFKYRKNPVVAMRELKGPNRLQKVREMHTYNYGLDVDAFRSGLLARGCPVLWKGINVRSITKSIKRQENIFNRC